MEAVLKPTHFLSLYLLLGGPLFWRLFWRPLVAERVGVESDLLARRVRAGVLFSASLFVLSGLGDALVAAGRIIDITDWEMLQLFFGATRVGRLSLVKIGLALITAICLLLAVRNDGGSRRSAANLLATLGSILFGTALLVTVSLTGHAATKPGLFPIISDVVHLVASIVWAGALFYFALPRWSRIGKGELRVAGPIATMVERFTNVALLAVALVAGTGAFASYLHVFAPAALRETSYGRTLGLKIALFLAVLAVAGFNLLLIGPGVKRAAKRKDRNLLSRTLGRLGLLVRIEAVVVAGVVVAASVLTTLPPADAVTGVRDHQWEMAVNEYRASINLASVGTQGEVEIDVTLSDEDGSPPPPSTRVRVHLEMLAHDMGTRALEAELVTPGLYRASSLVSMAGRWRADVTVMLPEAEAVTGSFEFDAALGSMSIGRERRFELRAVTFDPGRLTSFMSGGILLIGAIYMVVASRRRSLPRWMAPAGMMILGLAGYQLFGATLVDAYPTTFVRNPVSYSAQSVAAGRALFEVHCAACHGPQGRGDGQLAPFLDPPPADLSADHVDDHTDGDIFWWITHGIAGTAMPAMGADLTEAERWQVIQFVRSIRREGLER